MISTLLAILIIDGARAPRNDDNRRHLASARALATRLCASVDTLTRKRMPNREGIYSEEGTTSSADELRTSRVPHADRLTGRRDGQSVARMTTDGTAGNRVGEPLRTARSTGVNTPARSLLNAMRQVESGNNDRAIGDGGSSRGPLQVHKALWDEECRRMGVAWEWRKAAHSWELSCAVALSYWRHYGMVTDEARARSWNGGPRGPWKVATVAYWRRVEASMRKDER